MTFPTATAIATTNFGVPPALFADRHLRFFVFNGRFLRGVWKSRVAVGPAGKHQLAGITVRVGSGHRPELLTQSPTWSLLGGV